MTDHITPSELDALARDLADSAARQRMAKGLVRETIAAAKQALADGRDSAIFRAGYLKGIEEYAPAISQAVADSVVAELAAKGMLTGSPRVTVKRVARSKKTWLIKAVVETPG